MLLQRTSKLAAYRLQISVNKVEANSKSLRFHMCGDDKHANKMTNI